MSWQKVELIGNIGSIRTTGANNDVTQLSVATSSSYKDKNTDQFVEQTEWHRVVGFNKIGESLLNYNVGDMLVFEGQLRTSKYQKEGVDHYATSIILSTFPKRLKKASATSGEAASEPTGSTDSSTQATAPEFDDDIPF